MAHVPYSPVPTLPETISSLTTIAHDIRNRASGKPAAELLDVGCLVGHSGVILTGGASLAEGQNGGMKACPCPTDAEEQAKTLEAAAASLKAGGSGVKAFDWNIVIAVIRLLLDQFFPKT